VKEEVVRTRYFMVTEIQEDNCVLGDADELKPRRIRGKCSK